MAFYDYGCPKCGDRKEVRHPITENPEIVCDQCEERMRRVIHPAGIKFVGSGFYSTEYRGRELRYNRDNVDQS